MGGNGGVSVILTELNYDCNKIIDQTNKYLRFRLITLTKTLLFKWTIRTAWDAFSRKHAFCQTNVNNGVCHEDDVIHWKHCYNSRFHVRTEWLPYRLYVIEDPTFAYHVVRRFLSRLYHDDYTLTTFRERLLFKIVVLGLYLNSQFVCERQGEVWIHLKIFH